VRNISISVTEAARSFADCINRVRYQGASFVLHKNGVAVARLVPVEEGRAGGKLNVEDELERHTDAKGSPVMTHETKRRAREIW
jgi:antitoxin (DNA-binding transcriptional repressor) of toxin-antitoxin stability system